MVESTGKVEAKHLKRNAYLYIRQSSLRQVVEHRESTQRQYDLRRRATALGWRPEQIVVIDTDQGQSAARATDREGFQKLVTEAGLGRAGIVLGLEVSRLARNSTDWHRLLEICALTETLILDEDGLYDPCHFNDRLLLGLKGAMSEAELHVMGTRLRGGLLNKARRGELKLPLPIGLVYDEVERVVLDPDQRVQQAMRLFFETFRRVGSANGVVRHFHDQGLLFPRRPMGTPVAGEILWGKLELSQSLRTLRNPRYAGAYFYGRTRTRRKADGKGVECVPLPRDEWHTLHKQSHPGYISWEEYEENDKRLTNNAQAYGADRRRGPPREGPALLQGLVICSVCGCRLTVHYHRYQERLVPEYVCQQRRKVRDGDKRCHSINGVELDRAIGELLMESMTPMMLEVALAVQNELDSRFEELDQLRRAEVDSARYECELARRRFMRVDPDNRLVADSLEAEWNQKLRALEAAKLGYERQRDADKHKLSEEEHSKILALATDFPTLWSDPETPVRERKRMVQLLIEDVTISKNSNLTAHVRFKGGATKTLTLPLPQNKFQQQKTSDEVITEIDRLLNDHTYRQIADILNEKGLLTGLGLPFNPKSLSRVCRTYDLKTRYQRLRETGLLTLDEIAQRLDICIDTVRRWQHRGIVQAVPCNDANQCLYKLPSQAPIKSKGIPLAIRPQPYRDVDARPQEVQYEA